MKQIEVVAAIIRKEEKNTIFRLINSIEEIM